MGSFLDHLVGTWKILTAWGQPEALRLAGLFHSVFATDFFERPLVPWEAIPELRQRIGGEATDIVVCFCSIDRLQLAVDCADRVAIPAEGLRVETHRGNGTQQLSAARVGDLLVLEMANEAEQSGDAETGPGHWMTLCSHLARLARGASRVPPPVFDAGLGTLGDAAEAEATACYRRATMAEAFLPDPVRGEALVEACRRNPWVGEPWLLRAALSLREGRSEEALGEVAEGERRLLQWGTAWDKRRTWIEWLGFARALRGEAEAQVDERRLRPDGRTRD
jgi:hypothetical protein